MTLVKSSTISWLENDSDQSDSWASRSKEPTHRNDLFTNLTSLAGQEASRGTVSRKGTSSSGILCLFFIFRAQEKASDNRPIIWKKDAWIICVLSDLDRYSRTDAVMASLGVSFIDTRQQHLKDIKWKINYNWVSLSDPVDFIYAHAR